MIQVIRITQPECVNCMGSTVGDCVNCDIKTSKVTLCMHCKHRKETVMHSERLLCRKLHAWVEPTDFCAWGSSKE